MSNTQIATTLTAFDIHPKFASIPQYLNFVNSLPVLTEEQEIELVTSYQNGCKKSAHRLVVAHLRLSAAYAIKYSNMAKNANDRADYIQAANYGLMKSLDTFKLGKLRFGSYAIFRIREAIINHYIDNHKMIKIGTTHDQRKIILNINKYQFDCDYDHDISDKVATYIANDLQVKPSEVVSIYRRMRSDSSYDALMDDSGEDSFGIPQVLVNAITCEESNPLVQLQQLDDSEVYDNMFKCLDRLNSRAKDIIESRYLNDNKSTLQDLSIKYNISVERVRQIESDSLKKLKKFMTN